MPRGQSYSLTARLGLALALVFAISGAGITLAALAYGRNAAQQSFDRLLIGAANQIAEAITLRDGRVVADLPLSAFELLSLARDDRIVYAIRGRDGALVTGYDLLRRPKNGRTFFNAEFAGAPVRVAHVARTFAERSYSGDVDVLIGQTLLARRQLAAQITRNALIGAGLLGVATAAMAVIAVRSALRPLRRIEHNIAARAADDLAQIDVATPREIAGLVAALNRFMRRLDRQVGVMRSLIADASHQLRTPIAALRAQAELALDESDPQRLRDKLARIHRRSQGLSRLTDQLLNHALIIHRADAVPLNPLDLRKVAIRVLEETDQALLETGPAPLLDLPEEPVCCRGDALSLAEACKNLMWNALRHGQAPVTLAVTSDADEARLCIRDSGPGLPEAHWPDAGRRYVRDTGVTPDSAGLGLAIVQSVAEAHQGRLQFSRSDKGFEAALVLPRSREAAS